MTVEVIFYHPHPKDWGKVMFSVCVSVHTWGGGGVPTFMLTGGYLPSCMRGTYCPSDRGLPTLAGGYPSIQGRHPSQGRCSPSKVGTPPHTHTHTRRHSSTASTCYAAGSMPLAFTHADFLVSYYILTISSDNLRGI